MMIELAYNADGDLFDTADGELVGCHWFLKCTRNARNLTDHPVLGPVPTCDRCDTFAKGN
jgi:hypothetical protein